MKIKGLISQKHIEQKIFIVRGHKAMLDKDLARLYGVETRALNQAVKRNIERFPDDFIMALTRDEIMRISQSVTSPELKFSKTVLAFTEEGVAMLSGILKSRRAVQVNVAITRAFVRLRETLASNRDLAVKLTELERKIENHDEDIRSLFGAIRELLRVT